MDDTRHDEQRFSHVTDQSSGSKKIDLAAHRPDKDSTSQVPILTFFQVKAKVASQLL